MKDPRWTPAWKRLRKECFLRDKAKGAYCVHCGQPIDYTVQQSSTDDSYEPDHRYDVAAHPDRAFRRQKSLGRSEIECAKSVIWAAAWQGVYLEKNWSSMQKKGQYWEEFWELLPPKAMTIYGIDAHSTQELEEGYARIMEATDGV